MPAKRPTEKEVQTLITFLIDENPQTVDLVKKQLKTILSAHSTYSKILENAPDPQVAHEARVFLEETRLAELYKAFETLAQQGRTVDLEEGSYLLAKLAFPALKLKDISQPLDRMAEDMKAILRGDPASWTTRRRREARGPAGSPEIGLFRTYLFEEMGFRGHEANYYDPDNSFINRVLERRTGIPISLSCVYLLVARRLGMDAYGIGLPGHFIVGHGVRAERVYIDPYHKGRLLTHQECVTLVRRRGLAFRESFLEPTPNAQILARLMVNLMNIYTERGVSERAQWLGRAMLLFQEETA